MTPVLGGIQQLANETIAFVPTWLAAVVILVVGGIAGGHVGTRVAALLDRLDIDEALAKSSVGEAINRQNGSAGAQGIVAFFDLIVRWFV